MGTFVCLESDRFFSLRPCKHVCLKVDLSKDLVDHVTLTLRDETYHQRVVYINLSNTYYRCHFAHKIRDWPLMIGRVQTRNLAPPPRAPPPPTMQSKGVRNDGE